MTLPGQLPEYMRVGRGSVSGPLTGPYVSFDIGPHTDAGAIAANTIVAAFYCPFDFRIEAIIWGSTAATADCDLVVSQNTSIAVGGTSIVSAAIAVDTTAAGIVLATGTTPTLVAAARNVSQGDYIIVEIDGDGVSTDVTAFTASVIGFPYGHVNADPSYD